MDKLVNSNMKQGEDPESYFMEMTLARSELERMGETISDRRFQGNTRSRIHGGLQRHQDDDVPRPGFGHESDAKHDAIYLLE